MTKNLINWKVNARILTADCWTEEKKLAMHILATPGGVAIHIGTLMTSSQMKYVALVAVEDLVIFAKLRNNCPVEFG